MWKRCIKKAILVTMARPERGPFWVVFSPDGTYFYDFAKYRDAKAMLQNTDNNTNFSGWPKTAEWFRVRLRGSYYKIVTDGR